MAIRPLEGSQSWAKFLTLASAAKVRNAGFDIPLAPKKRISDVHERHGAGKTSDEMATGKMYKSSIEKKQRPVLGTRFDAYA